MSTLKQIHHDLRRRIVYSLEPLHMIPIHDRLELMAIVAQRLKVLWIVVLVVSVDVVNSQLTHVLRHKSTSLASILHMTSMGNHVTTVVILLVAHSAKFVIINNTFSMSMLFDHALTTCSA